MNDFLQRMAEIGREHADVETGAEEPRLRRLDEEEEAALLAGCRRQISVWQGRVARWVYAFIIVALAILIVTSDKLDVGPVISIALLLATAAHAVAVIRAPIGAWRSSDREARRWPASTLAIAFIALIVAVGPRIAIFGGMYASPFIAAAVWFAHWITEIPVNWLYSWRIYRAGIDISDRGQDPVQRGTEIYDLRERGE